MKRLLHRIGVLLVSAALLALVVPTSDARAYPGQSSYPTYNSYFTPGVAIGHLDHYVPQGLAYWPAKNAVVISYYRDPVRFQRYKSLLNIIDRDTGARKYLYIAEGHVGGMQIAGNYLWVANGSANKVRRYSLSKLANAKQGATIHVDASFAVKAASYLAIRDGDIFVGSHTLHYLTSGTMYRYNVSGGKLSKNPISSSKTPGQVQGVAFSGRYTFFSHSYGRGNSSHIGILNRITNRYKSISAPSMTEDLTVAGGWLFVNYESGASVYRNPNDPNGVSRNPITHLHHASVAKLEAYVNR